MSIFRKRTKVTNIEHKIFEARDQWDRIFDIVTGFRSTPDLPPSIRSSNPSLFEEYPRVFKDHPMEGLVLDDLPQVVDPWIPADEVVFIDANKVWWGLSFRKHTTYTERQVEAHA